MQDEINDILRLIDHPIKCSYRLIDGERKFILNSGLLFKLNKVLDIVENDSVDIILSEGQRKTLERFLKIVGFIPKLVISQRSAESFDNVIDLRKFKRLRYLELVRVCLDNTVGIDKLKTQLETFVCNRSTKLLEVIFKHKKLQWAELKCLDLRHSQLSVIDNDFFKHMPWIQTLDLSHNNLSVANGLESLDYLKCLNLSFNHLEYCPSLSKQAENKLEVLILSNNHISTVSEMKALITLETLDLSSNWISNKCELLSLAPLKHLTRLNLYGNPISFLKYYRVYVSSSLGKNIYVRQFLLDNQPLTSHELVVLGQRQCFCSPSIHAIATSSSTLITVEETPPVMKKQLKARAGKRVSKPREVIIQDISSEIIIRKTKVKPKKQETNFRPPVKNIISDENITKSTSDKENALMEQLSEIVIKFEPQSESPLLNKEEIKQSQDIEVDSTKILISATVHAHDESGEINATNISEFGEVATNQDSSDANDETVPENVIDKVSEEAKEEPKLPYNTLKSFVADSETCNDSQLELNSASSATNTNGSNTYQSSSSISDDSDIDISDTEDEVLWHVQRKDNTTGLFKNIILVLLDDELKERSTTNNRTVSRWPLTTVQSCIKTKTDPLTIEIEFDTLKKDKRSRTYVMEFADAQVLLKKMYSILEARPLSGMNQKTYKCIKCATLFVHDTPSAFKTKGSLISCTVCSSTLVVEVEEPRPPEQKNVSLPPVTHSSSQSSIGKGNIRTEGTTPEDSKTQCSATSIEPDRYERKSSFLRSESDIEVISNPSQSSIEVLDEHSRSTTPRRKTSSEERQGVSFAALPQLSTVTEVHSPFSNLTESSSSENCSLLGSLTESVITAYEALNINKKKFNDEEILTEEESSPNSEPELSGTIEEETPISIWKTDADIYSSVDFSDVDPRVKIYIYQELFEDDNEGLLMVARCHLWKTGGSDYDGCIVISNLKMYFLSHSRTSFKEDTCNWLYKFDCYNLKDVKEIAPLLWEQGARIQIKHISYLALLMDKEKNFNFFKFLKGLSLKGIKMPKSCSSSSELALQQAVLSASSVRKSIDPTVNFFTICLSITIFKDDVEDETLRLGGLVLTTGEFHLVPGELSWIATTALPSVGASQEMSSLIEVEKGTQVINLHFLDEKAALEEVWSLKCSSSVQVSSIVDAIRTPWEQLFSSSLEVNDMH